METPNTDPQKPLSVPSAAPTSTPSPASEVQPVSLTTSIADTPAHPVMPPAAGIPPAQPEVKNNRSVMWIISGLVVLLLMGLSGAFFLFNTQLKKQNVQQVIPGPTAIPMAPVKTLIIGTDATYPPMEYKDDTGNLVGYDIDLGNQIAAELGGKAEIHNIPWDNVFTALEQKKVDVIISSVTINDERKKQYLFSSPYINAGQVILTKKENTTILAPTDLKDKKVGVQKETTSETEAVKYTDPKLVTAFADYDEAAKALIAGKVDAVIIDLTAGKGIVDKFKALKLSSDPFTNEFYGVVLRKDEKVMQTRINQAISTLHEKGILDDIKQKWFQ